jgi:hypothetical protein
MAWRVKIKCIRFWGRVSMEATDIAKDYEGLASISVHATPVPRSPEWGRCVVPDSAPEVEAVPLPSGLQSAKTFFAELPSPSVQKLFSLF